MLLDIQLEDEEYKEAKKKTKETKEAPSEV
jgi:hypothetical protein